MSEAKIYTADEVNRLFKQQMDHKNDKFILISLPVGTSTWYNRYDQIYSINLSGAWVQLNGNTDFLTKPGNFLAYWTNSNTIQLRIIYDTNEFPNKIPTYSIYKNNSLLVECPSVNGITKTSAVISLTEGINYFVIK